MITHRMRAHQTSKSDGGALTRQKDLWAIRLGEGGNMTCAPHDGKTRCTGIPDSFKVTMADGINAAFVTIAVSLDARTARNRTKWAR